MSKTKIQQIKWRVDRSAALVTLQTAYREPKIGGNQEKKSTMNEFATQFYDEEWVEGYDFNQLFAPFFVMSCSQ